MRRFRWAVLCSRTSRRSYVSGFPAIRRRCLYAGQLAVDTSVNGRRIGSFLPRFAAERAIEASATVRCFGLKLIADKPRAFDWQLKHGFEPLVPGSLRLCQSSETLKRAAKQADPLPVSGGRIAHAELDR